ncbi:MAG: hypothetical protein ACI84E_001917, partial [Planctomycetota bacterium]
AGKGDFAIVPGPSESTPAFPEAARQGEGVALSKPIAEIRA